MGILKWTGKVFTSIINIRVDKWLGANYIKHSVDQTITSVKSMFIPEHAERKETFEEAIKRLNISEKDLKARESEFVRLFSFNLLLALLLFCYCIFLFYQGRWSSGCLSLCLTLYPISMAFRFHFWLFQIKNRKLGCSIYEWWNNK